MYSTNMLETIQWFIPDGCLQGVPAQAYVHSAKKLISYWQGKIHRYSSENLTLNVIDKSNLCALGSMFVELQEKRKKAKAAGSKVKCNLNFRQSTALVTDLICDQGS